LNKAAICVDFCGERLQGFGVVSAEILQFILGRMDEANGEGAGQRDGGSV
jgi:hypothetical protein